MLTAFVVKLKIRLLWQRYHSHFEYKPAIAYQKNTEKVRKNRYCKTDGKSAKYCVKPRKRASLQTGRYVAKLSSNLNQGELKIQIWWEKKTSCGNAVGSSLLAFVWFL